MKKLTLVFALVFGFVATSFAQTAPATGWKIQETDTQLKEGVNTIRMADGSIIRCNFQGGEMLDLVAQVGRERIVFDANEAAPAGSPQGKCPDRKSIQHCYYSTKDKMLVCVCTPFIAPAPSSDPTATREHILLARQVGAPQ